MASRLTRSARERDGWQRQAEAVLKSDTGAAATTLLPEVLDDLGYSARDGIKLSRVHSAIGEEHGYSLNVAEFSALGVTTPNFMVHVFG